MADVDVSLVSAEDPMRFSVTVREDTSRSQHEVTAGKADVERLCRAGENPEEFLDRVFEFLLAREPKESILANFELSVISKYFSEFESEISS